MTAKTATIVAAAIISVLGAGMAACGNGDATPQACADVFAQGKRTPELDRPPTCTDPRGRSTSIAQARWTCDDGSQLFANEYGYGVQGKPWNTDGSISTADQDDFSRGTPLGHAIDACQKASS